MGAVGPLVVRADSAVRDAGLVLGLNGPAGYVMRGWPAHGDGYAGSLSCAREVSAVSGECLMVSRRVLEQLGGLRDCFRNAPFQGADLSLRGLVSGRRNICTPRVVLRQYRRYEDAGADLGFEALLFADVWGGLIQGGDPYHNPNFGLSGSGFR